MKLGPNKDLAPIVRLLLNATHLFQLINRFYESRMLIVTTNKDFTQWGEFFHDDNVAVLIIDQIIPHSDFQSCETLAAK